ncbi:MAG TPA: hypothetical protein VIF62_37555 [Labilithrix sp.]|jgi:hypothetical protein
MGLADADRAAALEADAHRLFARGHELLAEAARARTPLAEPGDALVPIARAADVAATSERVVREAIRAGELTAYGGQRDRAVRLRDLVAWIDSRRVRLDGPADVDIERRVRRLAKGRGEGPP